MKNSNTKKNALVTSLAVMLAAAVVIGGGSFAYLQSSSENVVNNFDTNKVDVELEETTGNQYDIVPGTTEEKDPTVTIDNTVDSYLYVKVTDKTDGLVTYSIAEGWTLLDGYSEEDSVRVYYRTVKADAADKTYSVLADNQVTYDKGLENSDMLDENGNLKAGLQLSFEAFAIQQDPFNNALEAYVGNADLAEVDTEDGLKEALSEGKGVMLTEDITVTESITVSAGEDAVIYLAGYDLTSAQAKVAPLIVGKDAELTIKGNGTVDATEHATPAIQNNGGTIVLDGGIYTRSKEAGTSSDDNGGNSYYVINNESGTLIINDGVTIEADGKYSSLIHNGWQNGSQKTEEDEGQLIINGGTFNGGLNTVKNDDWGVLTINDGVFENTAQYCVMNWNVTTINGGTFNSANSAVWNGYGNGTYNKGELTVNGGTFIYPSDYYGLFNTTQYPGGTLTVNGGTYSTQYIGNKTVTMNGTLTKNTDGTYTVTPTAGE